ncbi:Rdx family-domain-containing protein [Daldinia vernicosa]|uniref:Rdx family-domain-containing protein n=1 Tax=Daldinia vernicosa TaxID=114800 RepID=UPI0020089B27|nr:Rdx family-domain-containing protein [Daldinia vernicosa]KAI0850959.1 Rdx family-domain-containing protein [Daldinia vernicosa]
MAETSTSTSTPTPTSTSTPGPASSPQSPFPLPRITIRFCTQCKWMLRAAYFAQELLSTFSTSLGEVALQPSTGGTFVVEIFFQQPNAATNTNSPPTTQQRVLWDRKTDGGFPETKELKRRVRDAIEPGRDLGHVDKDHSSSKTKTAQEGTTGTAAAAPSKAEDENVLGLNTHPGETIGGPTCKPGVESARTNALTQEECEDCK